MQVHCKKGTSFGKGNRGMFIERVPNVCAAGIPSAQPNERIKDYTKHYSMQDEVDALINDSIIPPNIPKLPLIKNKNPDMRNAAFPEITELINPPVKTKMQTLAEDFKNTVYSSYWKQPIGKTRDPTPNLPCGFKIYETTMGKKIQSDRLYDVILPKTPVPDKTSASKEPGYQTNRKYCSHFNPNKMFGEKYKVDTSGRLMKCCLQDDRVALGKSLADIMNTQQAKFLDKTQSRLGKPLAPNNNINCVPPGYAFGVLHPPDNLPECLMTCELNPDRKFFLKCLSHLNTLRKCLKKRFDSTYFNNLYREMKYYDKHKIGWLNKELIYEMCKRKYIRLDPALIEPLMAMWNIFNGHDIKYKTFVDILNHTQPTPDLPKVWDVSEACLDFSTTYKDMVQPREVDTGLMAGVPSGRYLDKDYPVTPNGCCKAHNFYFPEESDAKSCLNPSVFTLFGISHREMYAERTPDIVKKVFESAYSKKFSTDEFENLWLEAQKYHSKGIVCFETFRKALEKFDKQTSK